MELFRVVIFDEDRCSETRPIRVRVNLWHRAALVNDYSRLTVYVADRH